MKIKSSLNLQIISTNTANIILFLKQLSFLLKRNSINVRTNIFILPKMIKKISVLKSPHVHKTAWTQLENREFKTIFKIKQIFKQDKEKIKNIIYFFIKYLPKNIIFKIKNKEVQYI